MTRQSVGLLAGSVVLGSLVAVVVIEIAYATWFAPTKCGPGSHVEGEMPICVVPGPPGWALVLAGLAGGALVGVVGAWVARRVREVHHGRMSLPSSALPETRDALSHAADRLAEMLRALPDADTRIPGSTWTVGDTAAHVVTSLRHATFVAAGQPVPWAEGGTSAPNAARRIEELNVRALAAEPERDPRALASMLVTEVDDYLAGTRTLPPEVPMRSPYYLGDMAPDHAGLTGIQLSEVLVHGYDIAEVTGRPWPISADEARLALRAALLLTPAMVNPDVAHGHTGGYDLRIRGGPRVVFRFADGHVRLEEPGDAPVDCHVLAAPVPLLLLTYGRIPQWGPIAKGQLLTWGRRPWRAFGFRRLFFNP